MKSIARMLPFVFLASGCSILTPPKEQPVQREYVGALFGAQETNVFTLTPERRTIIVQTDKEKGGPPKFCAEPAADVAENIASSVKAIAEASARSNDTKNSSATLEASRSLNTSIVSLFYRSQGVQIFRDGLFSLCQAYMNGLIGDQATFLAQYNLLLDRSFALIAQEIPTAQTLRAVELSNQAANVKTAIDAALQKAQNAEAEAVKAAASAQEALKKLKEPEK